MLDMAVSLAKLPQQKIDIWFIIAVQSPGLNDFNVPF